MLSTAVSESDSDVKCSLHVLNTSESSTDELS